uniref:hypothetical protein n=1 Tax=Thaumasiovibrio occultus TaxID=1891184 RepID=UPI000B35432D|nr:hypothetical protein [Thaumasiovibrio occultus]
MKGIWGLLLLFCTNLWAVDQEADFLLQWELQQQQSEFVETFEKRYEGVYFIKFAKIPFEGELKVHNVFLEDISGYDLMASITTMGSVEFELIDFPDEVFETFNQSYFKWHQLHTLYFDSVKQQWISANEYQQLIVSEVSPSSVSAMALVWEYWPLLVLGFLLYSVFSSVSNSRRVNQSLADQEKLLAMQKEMYAESQARAERSEALFEAMLTELKALNEANRKPE